jgi:hypothetical protein
MKDLRFTGHMSGDYIDITFRTDMINIDDANFNITQITEGREFSSSDKQSPVFLKHFSGTFQEKNTTLAACKQFATDNGLNLRAYSQGTNAVTSLVHDFSDSTSDNN